MKSTIHEYQKQNLKKVSKTSIIFLGLIALTFTNNSKAASELQQQDLNLQDVTTHHPVTENKQEQLANAYQVFSKDISENDTEDTIVFNPNSVIETNYCKTLEEVIAESKLITETKEECIQPILEATNFKDHVDEDNQLIQSAIDTEAYPLNFEKINRSLKTNKMCNNNVVITLDLKL
ncbi:hypothetical protein [Flavobacterium sp.]|uniref:hypothetical protein n=1 Tax=Flavobacterium sp. TaxID=239 RepID=UPI0025EE0917|nr:hypothetical protein [Flavobacterium sp.]